MTRGVPGTGPDRRAGRVPVPLVVAYVPRLTIVPTDLFEQVQRSFDSSMTYENGRARPCNTRYLSTGIAVCAGCGRQLHLTSSGAGHTRIGCTFKVGNDKQCPASTYPMSSVERVAIGGLRDLLSDTKFLRHFEAVAAKELAATERANAEVRRRLEEQIKQQSTKLSNAIGMVFETPALAKYREAELSKMASRLKELEDQVAALTSRPSANLPKDALPNLRGMWDELHARAPFVPTNVDEEALSATLKRLISSIRLRRIDPTTFEAEIEYDLGPIMAAGTTNAKVSKTMTFDTNAEYHLVRENRKKYLEYHLARDFLDLSDEMVDRLSSFPSFRVFGDRDTPTRRKIVRALLFIGAHIAPWTTIKKILGDDYRELRPCIDGFRASLCSRKFILAANEMFPSSHFVVHGLRSPYRAKSSVLLELTTEPHPFPKLSMCISGSGHVRIPDDHWRVLASSGMGLEKRGLRRDPEKVSEGLERARLTLEALAIFVREKVTVTAAASMVGMRMSAVIRVYWMLRQNGDFLAMSEKLLELQAKDRA